MKKFIGLITLFIASSSFANQLHNYDGIKSAVTEGKLIRIYIDYTKCSHSEKQLTLPNNAAVYTPNAMAINTAGDIGAYILYFTMNDPRYPGKGVYQYGKFMISSDNYLTLTFNVLNAADYSPLEGVDVLHCKIDDGVKFIVSEQIS